MLVFGFFVDLLGMLVNEDGYGFFVLVDGCLVSEIVVVFGKMEEEDGYGFFEWLLVVVGVVLLMFVVKLMVEDEDVYGFFVLLMLLIDWLVVVVDEDESFGLFVFVGIMEILGVLD